MPRLAPGAVPGRMDATIDRLHALYPKLIDLGLERVQRLLGQLGNPQDHLPPVVHVAGTNGKGSTCAFLRAMGEAAGLRVHVTISPHLVHLRERFRIAGELVSEQALAAVLEEIEAVNGGERHHRLRGAGRRRLSPVLPDTGRPLRGRSRAGRPLRCDQRHRLARRLRHHLHLARPPGFPRQRPRQDCLGEGRHHEAWPACCYRTPATGSARRSARQCGRGGRHPARAR